MGRCAGCGKFIIGGIPHGNLRYCSERCAQNAIASQVVQRVPQSQLDAFVESTRNGECPACKGPGPVDLHKTYHVVSMIVVTRWSTKVRICCRRCGARAQRLACLECMALGWWGFPSGLALTPVQMTRNIVASFSNPARDGPTPEFRQAIARLVGASILASANCPACGYDVRVQRANKISRCPECGAALL